MDDQAIGQAGPADDALQAVCQHRDCGRDAVLCYLSALCGPVALVIGLKSLNAIKAEPHAEVAAKR